MNIEYELISSTVNISNHGSEYFYKIALDIKIECELRVNIKKTLNNILKPLIDSQILALPHDSKKYQYEIDFMTSYHRAEKYFCPLLMIYYPGGTNLLQLNFGSMKFKFDENPIVYQEEYDSTLGPIDQEAYENKKQNEKRLAIERKQEQAERRAEIAEMKKKPDIDDMASAAEIEQKAKKQSENEIDI